MRDLAGIFQRPLTGPGPGLAADDQERSDRPERSAAALDRHRGRHPINTLLTVEHTFGADGIEERFRAIKPDRAPAHAKIWTVDPDAEA